MRLISRIRGPMVMAVVALSATVTPSLFGRPDIRFDTQAALANWESTNGPEFPGAGAAVVWESELGHRAPGCLGLQYDFTGGGNYVQALCRLRKDNTARACRIWLNKPAEHRITFRATDSAGQTFQKSLDHDFPGWQQIEVDLTRWDHSFGGPGDGRVRFPVHLFGILIENTADPKQGTLLMDDIEWLDAEAFEKRPVESTYVAHDAESQRGWWTRGAAGHAFDGHTWRYAFDAGHPECSINTDFSLLGRPVAIRLLLDSDGSGHDVHLQVASHFQIFHRHVGRLDRKGEQTLEAPLGDMQTWEHFAGQDDGRVRYPLRFKQIALRRNNNGPPTGTVTLERIEIDTVMPSRQRVLMVPDVTHDATEAKFSVSVQNLRSAPATGRLVCDLRSLGHLLDRQTVDVTLPAAGAPARTWRFPAPLGQRHFTEAVFHWLEPDAQSPPVSIGMSTVPDAPPSRKLDPSSRIGVGLYLYRWHADHRRREKMAEMAELARRAGVKWTREQIDWSLIEPRPGEYRWEFYDEMIDTALAHGISVYGLLCYWSPYAQANTAEGIEQYCAWARKVVHRYKDRIRHWEIWNEPNIFFWSGPEEMYAKLLTRAYETIKTEDPEAVILGCSTSGIDREFIRLTMDQGGRFDELTIHPYRHVLRDLAYVRELDATQQLVDGRPIWITEMGWPSDLLGGRSERSQASLVARTYLTSLASDAVRNVSWYDFRNDGNDPYYHEMNFGLVRSDFRPKPGYRALATIADVLEGKQPVGQGAADAGEYDNYTLRFTDGRKDTVAICAPDDGRLLSFKTDDKVEIVNTVGEKVERIGEDENYSVTLDAGMPVYISGPAGFSFRREPPVATLTASATSARPGEQIEVDIQPAADVASWDLPPGWSEPDQLGTGRYRLEVPTRAATGEVQVQAILKNPSTLRLPLILTIRPKLLRL